MYKKLQNIMDNLNRIFCSEADFQHTLAWKLHEEFKDAEILLEYPAQNPNDKKKTIYHDIYIKVNGQIHLIELKYKTKGADVKIFEQNIKLKNHSAHDLGCCFFWLDVKRLEETPVKYSSSYCIMLTNDGLYPKGPKENTIYEKFSIGNERIYTAGSKFEIKYNPKDNPKSYWPKETRNNDMELKNNYICQWKLCDKIGTQWQYLLLEVKPQDK